MIIYELFVGDQPLGMQNHSIPNEAIKASSKLDDKHSASEARLNSTGAWVSDSCDKRPWIQLDLGEVKEVTKIATQGGHVGGVARFVGSYILLFSKDEESGFEGYKEGNKIKVRFLRLS